MTNPDITVLLPTCDRPDMFRIALRSIQAQSAVARIREVIVSESGRPSGAAEICEEFRGRLPIKYVLRVPPLSALEHEKALFGEAYASNFVAVLHDDDVWAPDHLQRALALLEKHPAAVLACSAFQAIGNDGELAPNDPYQYDAIGMFWFGSGYQSGTQEWVFGPEAMILSCIPGTPVHYSSMVARTPHLAACGHIYDFGNGYDKDRLLILALVRRGPVVYDPTPSVLVRMHAQQSVNGFALEEKLRHMSRTTSWAMEYAEELNFDFLAELHRRMDQCPPAEFQRIAQIFDRPWVRTALLQTTRRQRQAGGGGRRPGKILFVSEDAADAAAPRFLLEFLRWLRRKTDQEFELFLGAGGPLEVEFSEVAPLHSFAALAQKPSFLRRSFFQQFDLIYSNGCGSGALLERLPYDDLPVLTHLHELDAGINAGGAKNIAQVIRHTQHFFAGRAEIAECWRRRFRLSDSLISVHDTTSPAALAAAAPLLWQAIAGLLESSLPSSAARAAQQGLCDIFETWLTDEAPDRAFVLAKLARHFARRRARELAAEGRGPEAVQTLIRGIRSDNESKDPHQILEGLLEIGEDLAAIDPGKARFLRAEAEKIARNLGVQVESVRAYLAREARRPGFEPSPVAAGSAAPSPELASAGAPV